MKQPLAGMSPEALSTALDLKPFQGRQLFQWIHRKQVFDFAAMSNLSKALRERLVADCAATSLQLVRSQVSPATGTKKVLLALADGETVESVLIRDGARVTLCVSSQVGCALKCAFCATGLAGFRRDLTAGEIVEQALFLLAGENLEDRTPNVVYMGMGEPFRNYENVVESIGLLMHGEGLGIGARKITVSTAGDVKGITRFAAVPWQVRLSISLHAANDTLRSELVPLNRRYNLEALRTALIDYQERSGRQITFEWTLLDGVNDSESDARELVRFARGLKASVNLIPWNPVPGLPYGATPAARIEAFRSALDSAGLQVTVRKEKGQDIDAACGQLRRVEGES